MPSFSQIISSYQTGRYELLGVKPVEHQDDNSDMSESSRKAQKPEYAVVGYATTQDEADAVCRAGYYVKDEDTDDAEVIHVNAWRDTQKSASTTNQPIEKQA